MRDECIGSISIAAFQILRYIRRREYLEIPLEPGHFSKCASTTYDGINDTSGEAGKIPRLCLSFSTLSDESIVTIMRKKVCFSLMRDTFTGWKDTWQRCTKNKTNTRRGICSIRSCFSV